MHATPAIGSIIRRCTLRRWSTTVAEDPALVILRSALARPGTDDISDSDLADAADRYWPELAASSETRTEMFRLSSVGLDTIGRLAELGEAGKPLAREANHRLCELALFAQERAGGKSPSLDSIASGFERRERVWAYRQYLASMSLTLAVAVGCAVALATGRPTVAVALFAARISLDLASGLLSRAPTDLHQSAVRESPLSFRARYFGCVGSHLGDAILWSGFVAALATAGRPGWGLLIAALAGVSLFGSLARVGVTQIGLPAERTGAERFVRVGAAFVGLLVSTFGSPVAAGLVALVPAAFFASGEALQAMRRAWAQQATEVATLVRQPPRRNHNPAGAELTCGVVNAPSPRLRRPDRSGGLATLIDPRAVGRFESSSDN